MESDVKILLTSDLHLGINEKNAPVPESIRINTLKRIVSLAEEHDLFLVGGDFIEVDQISRDSMQTVISEFAKLRNKGTEIIYTPGIAELSDGELSQKLYDIDTTHLFDEKESSEPFIYPVNGQEIYIYGVPAINGYDISKIKKKKESGFHIGLFHVDFDLQNDKSSGMVYTIQKKDLKSLDLDFYALGHNHDFRMFKVQDRIIGAYSGSPEAVDTTETGDRYVISMLVKNHEISLIRRLSVNSVRINCDYFDCSCVNSTKDFIGFLEEKKSAKVLQEVVLTGERNFSLNKEEIDRAESLFYGLILTDKSYPSVESLIVDYSSEDSIRGEFYRILAENLESGNLPDFVDRNFLTEILSSMMNGGYKSMEELLCNLQGA